MLLDDAEPVPFVAAVCEGIAELAVGVAVDVVLPGRGPVLVLAEGQMCMIKSSREKLTW